MFGFLNPNLLSLHDIVLHSRLPPPKLHKHFSSKLERFQNSRIDFILQNRAILCFEYRLLFIIEQHVQ